MREFADLGAGAPVHQRARSREQRASGARRLAPGAQAVLRRPSGLADARTPSRHRSCGTLQDAEQRLAIAARGTAHRRARLCCATPPAEYPAGPRREFALVLADVAAAAHFRPSASTARIPADLVRAVMERPSTFDWPGFTLHLSPLSRAPVQRGAAAVDRARVRAARPCGIATSRRPCPMRRTGPGRCACDALGTTGDRGGRRAARVRPARPAQAARPGQAAGRPRTGAGRRRGRARCVWPDPGAAARSASTWRSCGCASCSVTTRSCGSTRAASDLTPRWCGSTPLRSRRGDRRLSGPAFRRRWRQPWWAAGRERLHHAFCGGRSSARGRSKGIATRRGTRSLRVRSCAGFPGRGPLSGRDPLPPRRRHRPTPCALPPLSEQLSIVSASSRRRRRAH